VAGAGAGGGGRERALHETATIRVKRTAAMLPTRLAGCISHKLVCWQSLAELLLLQMGAARRATAGYWH
jgi:hypothetical protein